MINTKYDKEINFAKSADIDSCNDVKSTIKTLIQYHFMVKLIHFLYQHCVDLKVLIEALTEEGKVKHQSHNVD